MRFVVLPLVVAGALAVAGFADAKSWPTLEFGRAKAQPGDRVAVRISLTPGNYVTPPRPGGPRVEIVLVPARLARTVNSVSDPGVVRVAVVHADLNWRGRAVFRVPDLAAGRYVGAYRIAGVFYAPRTGTPLDVSDLKLVVAGGGRQWSWPRIAAGLLCGAVLTGLASRRGRR